MISGRKSNGDVEASAPAHGAGDTFGLGYNGSSCGGAIDAVSFKYNMYGAFIGTLQVRDVGGAVRWSQSGTAGDGWQQASVPVASSGFAFWVVRGASWDGGIAVDDVGVSCAMTLQQLPLPPEPVRSFGPGHLPMSSAAEPHWVPPPPLVSSPPGTTGLTLVSAEVHDPTE